MGRVSFSDEVAEEILRRMSDGESLRKICRDDHMPDRDTVRRWEDGDAEFAAKCARAREHQGDAYVDQMDEVCSDMKTGAVTCDMARVLLSNMQWKASKLNRRYSDKLVNEHTGKDGGPIVTTAVTINAEEAKAINASLEDEC